eukprot:6209165-Pleurochrysis_carterae.AAC.1
MCLSQFAARVAADYAEAVGGYSKRHVRGSDCTALDKGHEGARAAMWLGHKLGLRVPAGLHKSAFLKRLDRRELRDLTRSTQARLRIAT